VCVCVRERWAMAQYMGIDNTNETYYCMIHPVVGDFPVYEFNTDCDTFNNTLNI